MPDLNPIIIGNWKMRLGIAESISLAKKLRKFKFKHTEVVVCPSFVSLADVGHVLRGSSIKLGAQDCFWESTGAFTGEVSVRMLQEVGCEYVIVGHSERRQNLGETNEMVHKKVSLALEAGLTPIVCVGETFEERQQGAKDYVLIQQTTKALEGCNVSTQERIFVAYEPVWVIGSGQAIAPEEAEEAHQVIRQSLFDLFPVEVVKNNFSVIYGGSVDTSNVASFTKLAHTAGVLVGGASIDAESFQKLIEHAYRFCL